MDKSPTPLVQSASNGTDKDGALSGSNTSSPRDLGYDFLRMLASLRVMLWHLTGWAFLTYVAAIPTMFALSGFLWAKSLASKSNNPSYVKTNFLSAARDVSSLVKSRLTDMLSPLWIFSLVLLPPLIAFSDLPSLGSLVSWFIPLVNPSQLTAESGWVSSPLWFLRTYLHVLLVLPLIVFISKNRLRLLISLAFLAVLIPTLELFAKNSFWALQDLFLYGGFTLLGFALHGFKPSKESLFRSILIPISLLPLFIKAFLPETKVVNDSHSLHMLVGFITVSISFAALPILRKLASKLHPLVSYFSKNSWSVYLLHSPVFGLFFALSFKLFPNLATSYRLVAVGLFSGVFLFKIIPPFTKFSTKFSRILKNPIRSVVSVDNFKVSGKSARLSPIFSLCLASFLVYGSLAISPIGVLKETDAAPPIPSRAPASALADAGVFQFLIPTDSKGPLDSASSSVLQDSKKHEEGEFSDFPAHLPTGSQNSNKGATNPSPEKAPLVPPPVLSKIPSFQDLAPSLEDAASALLQDRLTTWSEENSVEHAEVVLLSPSSWSTHLVYDKNNDGKVSTIPFNSITKSFTSALLLRAVEEGRVSLYEPIGSLRKYPWFDQLQETSLYDLLSHRSGFTTYTDTKAFKDDYKNIDSGEAVLRALMESPRLFAPGKSQAYSSSNYVIAGLLAEEIYGSDIESLIEENLLSPLGLGSMKVLKPSAGAPGTGTGNMVGSLKDLSRWAEAMWRSKQVLGEYGNRLVAGVDPVSLIGPLGFAYCPCKSISGSTLPAAYGMNGVYVTLRYYKALDTIVVIYLSKPLPDTIDSLVAALLDPATFPQGS